MWKMLLAFVAFAALALFVLMKSDGNIDMSGEKHGGEAMHTEEHAPATADTASAPGSAPVAASAASEAASAASN